MTMFILKGKRVTALSVLLLLSIGYSVRAQSVYEIGGQEEHIFNYGQIEIWRNTVPGLSIEEVLDKANQGVFKPGKTNTPQVTEPSSSDWFRIRLKGTDNPENRYLLEFFDQTIDHLVVYVPTRDGKYEKYQTGDSRQFFRHHKMERI